MFEAFPSRQISRQISPLFRSNVKKHQEAKWLCPDTVFKTCSLTHQAWGLRLAVLVRGDHWGSHYIRSTGTSSVPPVARLGWGPDPSEWTAMSQRTMCPPDRPGPSPASLESTGRQNTPCVGVSSAHSLTLKEYGKNERADIISVTNAVFLALQWMLAGEGWPVICRDWLLSRISRGGRSAHNARVCNNIPDPCQQLLGCSDTNISDTYISTPRKNKQAKQNKLIPQIIQASLRGDFCSTRIRLCLHGTQKEGVQSDCSRN